MRPQSGENWGIKPDRIPATYTRKQGVRNLLSALDLKTNKIYGHIKRRKTWKEVLQFLKYLRSLFDEKLYIIIDNYSSHKKEEVLNWCEENNVELVFLPTNASWLNRIECHFTAIRKFAIRNSNYSSHKELASAIRKYIRWRNKNYQVEEVKRIENKLKFT